jgi:hypothetical protein
MSVVADNIDGLTAEQKLERFKQMGMELESVATGEESKPRTLKNGVTGSVMRTDLKTGRITGLGDSPLIYTDGLACSTPELQQAVDEAEQAGQEMHDRFVENAANMRGPDGKFMPGSKPLPATLRGIKNSAKHRAVIQATVTTKDCQEVLLALMIKAKQGNLPAIVEFFNRVIGKPLEADVIERLGMLEQVAKAAAAGAQPQVVAEAVTNAQASFSPAPV